ncbi:type II secretion system F family protein [Nocardioides sp. GY 10127]|uniref:type II secretion system F family protein n=1 Tax=Nocardioides sp. GY 10127 TaxID=2569762 RepID=UPI0010A87B79|nr:type II secretion system F family protein [Nocardioides sp. GY 10127]TIC78580.1 hypothetical protein E8D37_19615 [Nocardioides sp. GY 10127]
MTSLGAGAGPWVLACAAGAAGAASLLVSASPRLARLGPSGARPVAGRRPAPWLVGVVSAVGFAVLLGQGRALGTLVAVSPAVLGAAHLVRAGRRERAAVRTGEAVAELCEHLAGDLVAGRPPGVALEDAARAWPPAGAVAEAHRVGADVPTAWRALAARPGAGDLRLVAAAWELAQRTGHGLADALSRCVDEQTRARATRRTVRAELASARATARLVAGLPVPALLMGASGGSDPVGFLLTTTPGTWCLGLGLLLGTCGLAWVERLAARATKEG